jgi:hypothetical protein
MFNLSNDLSIFFICILPKIIMGHVKRDHLLLIVANNLHAGYVMDIELIPEHIDCECQNDVIIEFVITSPGITVAVSFDQWRSLVKVPGWELSMCIGPIWVEGDIKCQQS